MTSSDPCNKVEQSTRYGKSRFLLAALFLWTTAALASGPGPNGVNIGFDFNWNPGPLGYSASFIQVSSSSGASLNNCTYGAVTAMSSACDFVFAYSIGGIPQTAVISGGVYETYPTLPTPPACNENPMDSAPLTLFNCFNSNSFGQVFLASATGTLTAFSMNLTCLNPAGSTLTGLFAVIYLVNSNGTSIPATPLGSTPVNLSTCPTLTTWSGHAFSSADFAAIPINFNNVTLTAGNFYAVYFSGLVPGAGLPGSPAVTSVTPSTGPPAGGNTVTITGTDFTGATSVTFGGVAATSFTVVNDTTITSVVPSGSTGAVSVIVTNGIGSNAANTLYSYAIPTPTPTPTLGEWGMIAFAGLLVLFAIFKLRRVDKSATA
jgi:IPT/TIG domain/IPTL-CTERM motif